MAFDAEITAPDGTTYRLPGFYDGDRAWRIWFMPYLTGEYTYQTICTDTGCTGRAEVRCRSSITGHGAVGARRSFAGWTEPQTPDLHRWHTVFLVGGHVVVRADRPHAVRPLVTHPGA